MKRRIVLAGKPVILCAFDGLRVTILDMAGHINAWRSGHGDEYGSDEYLIAERLWPTIREKTLVHTEFGDCHDHGGICRPFPTRRAEGLRFIGERICEDNHPNGEDRDCYVAARQATARSWARSPTLPSSQPAFSAT